MVLPADEREAVAELEQERLESRDQGVLEVAFGGGLGEVEEVQHVGVAGELLGELAVGGGELGWEVGWGGPDPMVQVGGDVVGQDVAGPAVYEGRGGVPVPHGGVGELVEQDRDVAPWQLRNRLLRNQACSYGFFGTLLWD